jgi:hypothetical protein
VERAAGDRYADTSSCADSVTAWASATPSGQDTLTLGYITPVIPAQVNIYQTYSPGAITGIELVLADGSGTLIVPGSADPGTPCPGVFTIDITQETSLINGVIIHLDQSITGDWNEIDAVELVGTPGEGTPPLTTLWASQVSASSQASEDAGSAMQAAGEPDTTTCEYADTAWAASTDSGPERLFVYFPSLVTATRLDIYQTLNLGAITGVELVLEDGSQVMLEDSADPGISSACPGVFTLMIREEKPVAGVIIYLNQSITGGLNQIDAVSITGEVGDEGLLHQWATRAQATSEYGEENWAASQATGAPNTPQCGDIPTAWASLSSSGQETLTLDYDTPVIARYVSIYQTYNPGAITGIELVLADGSGTLIIPGSADPGTLCPGVLTIPIDPETPPVNGVIIDLDQSITNVWNEIDAVELAGVPAE